MPIRPAGPRGARWRPVIGAGALATVALVPTLVVLGQETPDGEPARPPAHYDALREARVEHVGRVQNGRIEVDRFELQLDEGHLYLLAPVSGRTTGAVYLGAGTVRAYPPDAVEHHQLRKHLDAHWLEDRFDRLVLRFSDDTGERLRALAEPAPGGDPGRAQDLFEDLRDDRFRDQLINPDSWVAADLHERALGLQPSAGRPGHVLVLVDGDEHDWFAIEVDPEVEEEVGLTRYDRGREMLDVWMNVHARTDFEPDSPGASDPFLGLPVDPDSLDMDDDEITGVDLGLPVRPLYPSREGWRPRVEIPLVTTDLALDDGGKVRGTTALLIEPQQTMGAIRLRISPWLRVTDARWRDVGADGFFRPPPSDADPSAFDLLVRADAAEARDPDEPAPVRGEQLPVVQERRTRRMTDDWFEPWVTIALPRLVAPGDRFVLELAYEGKLLEKIRASGDYLLLDTIYWMPMHPDSPHSVFHLTFRVRERDEIVSSGTLLEDRVDAGTRIVRRLVRTPAMRASFHYGRFDVTTVEPDGLPPITMYADRNRLGIAPGIDRKTIEDLSGALSTHQDYFGPYPFDVLEVAETPATSGQAFPGFLLLSFQSFGELHTGESELFRSHEVAHQWWGAGVHWRSYRDQWLSEGFAHYGAALYVLAGLGNEEQFREILSAWRLDVLGEVNVGQGRGAHYGVRPAVIRESDGSGSGPLVAGLRLRSTSTPFDYRLLVYEKGAFVLHMLRSMLLEPETGSDRRFRDLMRGFAAGRVHANVTTAMFEAAVTEAFGEPMGWFFDQWVYGVDVPTYRPRLEVVSNPDGTGGAPFLLRGTVTQEDVPDGFRMPVPIAVRFQDREPVIHHVWVDRDRVEVTLPLPALPTGVEFNYLHGVLATVR